MTEANTPQHMTERNKETRSPVKTGIPTGPNTAPPDRDVADPHPDDEEHYRRERHPGGEHPPENDIGPNNAVHNGSAPPRPHNAGSGPE